MRIILEFDKFKAEYRPIRLFKGDCYLVNFGVDKTEEKEKLVRSIINDYYPDINKSTSINVNGRILSTELLNKSQKNLKIMYVIADIMLDLGLSVKYPNDIISFIRDNSYDLFYPDGVYFDYIYNALRGVTESGALEKKKVLIYSKNILKVKDLQLIFYHPTPQMMIYGEFTCLFQN